jgi:DNA repair protein RadC
MFKINSPEDDYNRLNPTMRESKKEYFVELCLDTKNQIIREKIMEIRNIS